jgi:hypothetical protein
VFWTGKVLFVKSVSAVDSLPIVAGRSEVVGVSAPIDVEGVNTITTPIPNKVEIAIMLKYTVKL